MSRQQGPAEVTWTMPEVRMMLEALNMKIHDLPPNAAIRERLVKMHDDFRLMYLDAANAGEWTLTVARSSRTYDAGKTVREQELADMAPSDRQRIFDAYDAAKEN